jgi:Glycine rich protein
MALRVAQVRARESRVDAQARNVESQMPDEERFWGRMPHARRVRLSRFRSGVLALALVGAWLAPVAAPPAALGAQISHIFNYTGAMHNWTVPAGVHLAHFDVRGAQGGGNDVFGIPVISGGEGGRTVAEVRVFPGEVIHIFVGGKGGDGGTCPHRIVSPPPAEHSRGGFNGGGNGGGCGHGGSGGGGGGGASDIRVEGTHLSNRYIIAGGGGGSSEKLNVPCGFSVGGGGGGHEGAHGVAAVDGCIGGTGGTRTSGGAQADYPEGRGSLGFGGTGKLGFDKSACGGGGGGGYYGGGGGWLGAGGGGGSGFGPRVDFPPVKFYTGVHKGNGQVVITWDQPD